MGNDNGDECPGGKSVNDRREVPDDEPGHHGPNQAGKLRRCHDASLWSKFVIPLSSSEIIICEAHQQRHDRKKSQRFRGLRGAGELGDGTCEQNDEHRHGDAPQRGDQLPEPA